MEINIPSGNKQELKNMRKVIKLHGMVIRKLVVNMEEAQLLKLFEFQNPLLSFGIVWSKNKKTKVGLNESVYETVKIVRNHIEEVLNINLTLPWALVLTYNFYNVYHVLIDGIDLPNLKDQEINQLFGL